MAREDDRSTALWAATLMSIPLDYLVKASGTGHVNANVTDALPIPNANPLLDAALLLRCLRLNCISGAYSSLWSDLFDPVWLEDRFTSTDDATLALGDVSATWSPTTPLRTDYDRWLALCEIDSLVALLLGLTEMELIQMYRSQFAVLRKNETRTVFDGNGRQISGINHAFGFLQAQWEAELKTAPVKRGESRTGMWDRVQAYRGGDTTVDLGPFKSPFRPADRETAMRRAYRAFAERVEANS
jgi:hypothetical protein